MINQVKFFFFLCFIFTASVCSAQVPIDTAKVYGSYIDVIDSLVIQESNKYLTFLPNGVAEGTIGSRNVRFKIPISEDMYLESVYLADYDSMLIFFYVESMATHASTHFIILNKQSLQIIAKEDIYAFNLAVPVFRNHYMYLMTFGFVGKYDLKKKRYVWIHSNLYNRQRYTFNIIDQPQFKNGKVIFTSTNRNLTDTLIVDNSSGKILLKTN